MAPRAHRRRTFKAVYPFPARCAVFRPAFPKGPIKIPAPQSVAIAIFQAFGMAARPVTKSIPGRSAGVHAGLNSPHSCGEDADFQRPHALSRRGRRRSATLSLAVEWRGASRFLRARKPTLINTLLQRGGPRARSLEPLQRFVADR